MSKCHGLGIRDAISGRFPVTRALNDTVSSRVYFIHQITPGVGAPGGFNLLRDDPKHLELLDEALSRFKVQIHRQFYFYNLGRGTTVDQDALIAALKSGHIAGAGLDVTDPEPLDEDSELWAMENVFITAHTSGNSPMVRPRLIDLCIGQVRLYRDGEDLLNVVDQTQGY